MSPPFRHKSFGDVSNVKDADRIDRSRLEVDFEYAGHILQMRSAQAHLGKVAMLLQVNNIPFMSDDFSI